MNLIARKLVCDNLTTSRPPATISPEQFTGGSEWTDAVVQPNDAVLTYEDIHDLEQENIERALAQSVWKIAGPGGTAERLGVKPTTLNSKLKAFGIRRRPR